MVSAGDAAVVAVVARRGLVAEGALTSLQEGTLEIDLHHGEHRTSWLTRDNPFLTAAQTKDLDEQGLVRPGSILKAHDVIASVLGWELPWPERPSQAGKVWAQDNSWDTPAEWDGAQVVAVRVLKRGELDQRVSEWVHQRLCVELRVEHPLAVGDLLQSKGDAVGVLGELAADADMPRTKDGRSVDLVVPLETARRLGWRLGESHVAPIGRAELTGLQFAEARSMGGGYSLISRQPLGGKWGTGQRVTAAQIRWLRDNGMTANLAELVSLKSDDLQGRAVVQKHLSAGTLAPSAIPEAGAPESLLLIRNHLMALGLAVVLEDRGHAVAMAVRPASTEDVLRCSAGPIRRPETLNYKTLLEVEGGLCCPNVFGARNHSRRLRWGHYALPWPVVSPLWRFGAPSILERLLERSPTEVNGILDHLAWVRHERGKWEVVFSGDDSNSEPHGRTAPAPMPGYLTGGPAVEAMLRTVAPDRLPPGLRFRPDALVLRAVPIPPPDTRPVVLLENGNFATSDLNDHYLGLVNRGNRLSKLEELNAPEVILWNERRELQRAADALWANCLAPEASAVLDEFSPPRRLRACLDLTAASFLDAHGKRVDWSAQARAVASATVKEHRLRVPRNLFTTLRLDPDVPVLVTTHRAGGAFVALSPEAHDDAVIVMAPMSYGRLGLDEVAESYCVLHRPLGAAACAEARRLLNGTMPRDHATAIPRSDQPNWTDATSFNDLVSGLVEAAVNEAVVLLDSPRGLLVGGPGRIDFIADKEVPVWHARVSEMPGPTKGRPSTSEACPE
jgi:hypothetical protein